MVAWNMALPIPTLAMPTYGRFRINASFLPLFFRIPLIANETGIKSASAGDEDVGDRTVDQVGESVYHLGEVWG